MGEIIPEGDKMEAEKVMLGTRVKVMNYFYGEGFLKKDDDHLKLESELNMLTLDK